MDPRADESQGMMNDLYEEQARQLQEARDMHAQSETYASEMRSRVAKLNERNSSSEVSVSKARQHGQRKLMIAGPHSRPRSKAQGVHRQRRHT
jgi:hypothetical protein